MSSAYSVTPTDDEGSFAKLLQKLMGGSSCHMAIVSMGFSLQNRFIVAVVEQINVDGASVYAVLILQTDHLLDRRVVLEI